MRGLTWRISALAVALLCALGVARPAGACSMVRTGPIPSTGAYVDASSVVVEGRVLEVLDDDYPYWARVEVVEYLKGAGPAEITIYGFGQGGGDCLEPVREGQHAIFYAFGDPTQTLSAVALDVFRSTDRVEPTRVAQIREAARLNPDPPSGPRPGGLVPTWEQPAPQPPRRAPLLPLLAGAALLLLASFVGRLWLRRRRTL